MGLADREYMYETYEEKKKVRQEKEEKRNRKNELWSLYAKKHKTRKDKQRIKELEYFHLHGEFPLKKKCIVWDDSCSIGQVIFLLLILISILIYIYVNYFS